MSESQKPVSQLASMFATDKELEKNGVEVQYGNSVFLIARAGGANARYNRILEAHTKPVRRMIQTETLPPDQLDQIFRQVYADAVFLNWWTIEEIKQDGTESRGNYLEHPVDTEKEGKIETEIVKLGFTKQNVIMVMRDLPDLFEDIKQQANKPGVFKRDNLEAAVKN